MANKELILNSEGTTEQKVLALLMCIGREVDTAMSSNIKELNLSIQQLHILHCLSYAPKETLTVNQLKGLMVEDNSNVSRSLNKLMERGCITKERSMEDQRTVFIKITSKGKKQHIEADKKLSNYSLGLKKSEIEALFKILKKL